MTFPATRGDLTAAGWELAFIRNCRRCAKSLEFWRAHDKVFHPLEIVDGNKLQTHFSTCPFAKEFRKPKQQALFA